MADHYFYCLLVTCIRGHEAINRYIIFRGADGDYDNDVDPLDMILPRKVCYITRCTFTVHIVYLTLDFFFIHLIFFQESWYQIQTVKL